MMYSNTGSKGCKSDDSVVSFDSVQNKPLVNCPFEVRINEHFDKELNELPDYCPLIFEEKKCLNDSVAIFVHKNITSDQEQIDSRPDTVCAKCITPNHETFLVI